MRKAFKGCLGIGAVICVIVTLAYELTREKKPPPPEYTGPGVKHEKLDKRALTLLKKGDKAILKSGDTTITWVRIRKRLWDEYSEQKRLGNSAYLTFKMYNENLDITFESEMFQNGMYTGWSREYNRHGKLVRKFNMDRYFDFDIQDLTRMMKKEYGIDLTKQLGDGQWATRSKSGSNRHMHSTSPSARYLLTIRIDGKMRSLEIDGEDGRITRNREKKD